jgi:hypothetical protein
MKLSEFINKATKMLDKYGDADLLVDTEAAQYTCHMVEITGLYNNDEPSKHYDITLDHTAKLHLSDDERDKMIAYFKNIK